MPAAAEWTAVGVANDIYAAFADRETIRRDGAVIIMSGLYDFRRQDYTPEGKALYSTVVLREYDCGERRVRLLSSIDYAGHMASGAAVAANLHRRRWEPVVAGGIDESYWQFACGAR